MITLEQLSAITIATPSKIVLLVMDGLGGLPHPDTGKTELETARTPNLDRLAREGACGLTDPVSPGITPGSAPAHQSLFGYDPCDKKFEIGRGVLEALGIGVDLAKEDIAARGNFCTVDSQGVITDRRAGRIATEKNTEFCRLLAKIKVDGAELKVLPVKEHRFVLVLRGEGLRHELTDTDPEREGVALLSVRALSTKARQTVKIVNQFVSQAKQVLANSHPANMVLLRGFSQLPNWPTMSQVFKLKPAAIAVYPMYRGLAKLVGMEILDAGSTLMDEMATLRRHYSQYDFFFLHVKRTDSAGEDGNFAAKVQAIEEVDAQIPQIMALHPDVVIVTGDHSTPAVLKGHGWQPVPFLLHSKWCRPGGVTKFGERDCLKGELGRMPALNTMPLALANALKLIKYGA